MDFMTINQIAFIRQHENANSREARPRLRPLRKQLGGLFVTIGQRMVQANSRPTENYRAWKNEACG
jgi:hypothetical protein